MKRPAYYLISQHFHNMSWHDGVGTAWNYDGRGAKKLKTDRGPYTITNISGEFPTSYTREMQVAKEGVFTLETTVVFSGNFDGFEMCLYDADENNAMRIITKDGEFTALGADNQYVSLYKPDNKIGDFNFEITLDFDEGTITYYINQMWRATLPLLEKSFKFLKFGTLPGYKTQVEVKEKIDFYANYPVCDSFIHFPAGSFPHTWKKKGNCYINGDDELVVVSEKGKKSVAKKEIKPQKGNILFNTYYFNYSNGGKTSLDIKHGKTVLFNVTSENGRFYLNGENKRRFLDEMWYRFRFELDTKKGKGKCFVNSKEPYEFTFEPMSIDCLEYTAFDGAELRIDNVQMEYVFEYSDYCPKPVPPKGYGDYTVGINMCSLWKTGHHIGWDCITPYPEVKPVLGYYDEGLPEVADWEIKFMVENGVNTQYYCWYLGADNNKPIKKTRLSDALVDGFMNAKYSDLQQFSLIFEAGNSQPASSEAFRRYIVPFWIENFFSDRRFARIDNKAIMCIYAIPKLIQSFGGADKLRDELNYLRNEVKKLGYDDLMIFTNQIPSQQMVDVDIDACYTYGWGRDGYDLNYQIHCHENMEQLSNFTHFIPTASTGYNRIPWDTERTPCISVADFKSLLYHFRDNLLPKYTDRPKWVQKFIMLSNWNEFGEGTYIAPSGLNEFGYLECVREVFTGGCASNTETNIKPSANQLKRLSTLYPQDRKTIRCLERKPLSRNAHLQKEDLEVLLDMTPNLKNWTPENCRILDGGENLKNISTNHDAKFLYNGSLGFDCGTANAIYIKMYSEYPSGINVYYTTSDYPQWARLQVVNERVKSGEHEYIIPLQNDTRRVRPKKLGNSVGSNYTGKLLQLRIDPNSSANVTSEFYEIKLCRIKTEEMCDHIFIDGFDLVLDNDIVWDNGHPLAPAYPERMFMYKFNAAFKWNPHKKILLLMANHASVEFYLGTNKAKINGETVTLDCLPYFDNGLPMIPVDLLCKVFKYDYEVKNGNIYITTPFAE